MPVLISIYDLYLGKDVVVGSVVASGKAVGTTILSVNLDSPIDGYRAELKRVILSLKDVWLPGPDGVPGKKKDAGVQADDDGNGIDNDDGEFGFPGSDDVLRTVYAYPNISPSVAITVGGDKKPGIENVDDDKDGTEDNLTGEAVRLAVTT